MPVNLSDYECIPTTKEYNRIFKKVKKIMIPQKNKIRSIKSPICKIFVGPPGSGKSRIADKDKINIDIDQIINMLYESKELKKLSIKHGNVFDSCGDIASMISDDLINLCVKKHYDFSIHTLYGLQIEFFYFLRENSYKIKTFYVYNFNAYNNNIKRHDLNLSTR